MASWDFTAWNDEIPKVDHETAGLDRLLAQYGPDNAVRLRAMLDIFLAGEATISGATGYTGIQGAEELAYQLLALRSIYTATGVNLDNLGRLLGLARNAYAATDDVYRLLLLVKILVNRSNGRLPELLTIIERVGVTEPIAAYEYHPASLTTVATDFPADPAGAAVWGMIRAAKAAGVRWDFVFSTYSESVVFQTSPDPAADQTNNAQGTSNIAGTSGGRIARSYT